MLPNLRDRHSCAKQTANRKVLMNNDLLGNVRCGYCGLIVVKKSETLL